jgi:hypothetical protein
MTSELKEVRGALEFLSKLDNYCAEYKDGNIEKNIRPKFDYANTKVHTYGWELASNALTKLDSYIERQESRELAKYQPCGCVVCSCEDDIQCTGCGAKNCGTHKVGEIPNPVKKAAIKVIKQGI